MLKINMSSENGKLVVTLEGRLDAFSSPKFEEKMAATLADTTAITIDMEKLEYISSAGLRTILETEQYLEDNDCEQIKVINANAAIKEILELTGFDEVVSIE